MLFRYIALNKHFFYFFYILCFQFHVNGKFSGTMGGGGRSDVVFLCLMRYEDGLCLYFCTIYINRHVYMYGCLGGGVFIIQSPR